MIKLCDSLLDTPDVESGIRVGDVYALMVEYYHSQGDMTNAYALIQRIETRKLF